ncbi:hypothetical protein H7I01_21530 [Mycobacterium palustre]|nr:hypothetical protein [Mycobacterium palustre]
MAARWAGVHELPGISTGICWPGCVLSQSSVGAVTSQVWPIGSQVEQVGSSVTMPTGPVSLALATCAVAAPLLAALGGPDLLD